MPSLGVLLWGWESALRYAIISPVEEQIHDAEGTYNHERKAILITVITRAEFNDFKHIMKQVDPTAFVSVSENVHILGRFVEVEN